MDRKGYAWRTKKTRNAYILHQKWLFVQFMCSCRMKKQLHRGKAYTENAEKVWFFSVFSGPSSCSLCNYCSCVT